MNFFISIVLSTPQAWLWVHSGAPAARREGGGRREGVERITKQTLPHLQGGVDRLGAESGPTAFSLLPFSQPKSLSLSLSCSRRFARAQTFFFRRCIITKKKKR